MHEKAQKNGIFSAKNALLDHKFAPGIVNNALYDPFPQHVQVPAEKKRFL
jgi:hypothetical protein